MQLHTNAHTLALSQTHIHTHTHMQICAYFVIVFWRVYGKLHSPFSCCFCCCCQCCCWHLRQQLQQSKQLQNFFKIYRIDRFDKKKYIYKIKYGNNKNNMDRRREHLRHFRCARRADAARGEIDGGLPAVVSPISLSLHLVSPSPFTPLASSPIARAIHLVIAHPTCRGGASASFAHWGIAAVAAIVAVVAF